MNPIYSHLYLDLQHKTIDSVNLKQYDYEARYIRFHITDNGNPYTLTSDIQAEIKIHKPDNTKVVNFATVDCSSNHITVKITSQMTSMYGVLHADITLFREENTISTMPFLLNIEKSPVQNEDIISSDEYGVLEDLITEVQANEALRQSNEEARKRSENTRNLNEEARKSNENIRIENENARKKAETGRENNENIRKENEKNRISNEETRQTQESDREKKTSAAIQNAQQATQAAIDATTDLQGKLDSHHFVLTEDKDMANGVPSLDADRKVPLDELRDATTMNKGIVQLTDSVISASTTTAATPNSVKAVYDALNTEKNRLSNVENKSSATIRSEITKSNVTNALGYTPYTPNEVDNKLSALETNIDWKESVNTFNDITTTYPNPQDGWTVNVKDTDYTYRYNGSKWVAISANAIPKATQSVDGLLSKDDKKNYDDANSKKHTHANKSVLDGITENDIKAWNNINSHTHDDRYYTKSEMGAMLNTGLVENVQGYVSAHKSELQGAKGDKGDTGATGPQGVSVSSVTQTTTSTADAGENVITVTLSNNNKSTFKVKNGNKGSTGTRGTRWSLGTAITGTSTTETGFHGTGLNGCLIGDWYVNVTTGNVYVCANAGDGSNAKWKYVANIKGPKGDTGPSGSPWGGGTFNGRTTFSYGLIVSQSAPLEVGQYVIHSNEPNLLHIDSNENNDASFLFGKRDSNWSLSSFKNGIVNIGTPNYKFNTIYATSGSIVTSDKNYKCNINDISDKYLQFFELLKPVSYLYKDGTSGRAHVGFISQDVENAMNQVGLSSLEFAGFCKDKMKNEIRTFRLQSVLDDLGNEILDELGNVVMQKYEEIAYEDVLDDYGNPVYIYSLRYEEFIALNTAVIQQQQAKIASLEQRLEKLEERFNETQQQYCI